MRSDPKVEESACLGEVDKQVCSILILNDAGRMISYILSDQSWSSSFNFWLCKSSSYCVFAPDKNRAICKGSSQDSYRSSLLRSSIGRKNRSTITPSILFGSAMLRQMRAQSGAPRRVFLSFSASSSRNEVRMTAWQSCACYRWQSDWRRMESRNWAAFRIWGPPGAICLSPSPSTDSMACANSS